MIQRSPLSNQFDHPLSMQRLPAQTENPTGQTDPPASASPAASSHGELDAALVMGSALEASRKLGYMPFPKNNDTLSNL